MSSFDYDVDLDSQVREGEIWLRRFETPGPSPDAITRVKLAARSELSRRGPGRLWAAWHGVLAAAAAIALAVTVGWYAMQVYESPGGPDAVADLLPAWSAEMTEEFTRYSQMDSELSDLESWADDESWALGGSSLYEALQGDPEIGTDGDAAEEAGALLRPRQPAGTREDVT